MANVNKAAYITGAKAKPLQVLDAPFPAPGADDVVIKNHAIAINPVDWKIQEYDFFVKKYPFILGEDISGEIHQVGANVKHFTPGDRVIAHCLQFLDGDNKLGGFQQYTLVPSVNVAKIPDSLPYTSAAVLPLSISTAAAALFQKDALALTPPTTTAEKTAEAGKSVLVWGGSSSVGATAIQLAAATGAKVISVASAHNVDKVRELGAAAVFDYKSATVVDDIVAAAQGTEFAGVFDSIGTEDSVKAWVPVQQKLGGRIGSVDLMFKHPEGAPGTGIMATAVVRGHDYIGKAVWGKYIPEALEKGVFKVKPDPLVIEGGLEKLQEGVDKLRAGVSFQKIVIAL